MIEFIQSATKSLGIDEKTARSATGSLIAFVKKQVDPQMFEKLTSALPGSAAIVGAAPEAKSKGGMMGGLGELAASSVGGKMGGAAEMMSMLGSSGLDAGKAGAFVKLFTDFVKQKASPELFRGLMDKIPQLGKLMG